MEMQLLNTVQYSHSTSHTASHMHVTRTMKSTAQIGLDLIYLKSLIGLAAAKKTRLLLASISSKIKLMKTMRESTLD